MTTVHFGVDSLLRDPAVLDGAARVGLVTNDAARLASDPTMRSRAALQAAGVPLVRLFGPEHGLGASAPDGAAVGDSVDAQTGLPVVSLYGSHLRPTREMLADLDGVLFDIPDVGARFYTYTWTLYHVLHACADAGVPLVVCDRPNPLGGVLAEAEGPMLELAHRSFVGEARIPLTHQCTLGELARLWQRELVPRASLTVIPCNGWSRAMPWAVTGLPWVPTSPSMPSVTSARVYPGTCLFEATNVSAGRGTSLAFQQVGAPWMDAERVCTQLAAADIDDVMFEPVAFTPSLDPYGGVACCGVRIIVTGERFRPVASGLQLLAAVARTHPDAFAWAGYPTAANPSGAGHLARLLGRDGAEGWIGRGGGVLAPSEVAEWTGVEDWGARVEPVLLYG